MKTLFEHAGGEPALRRFIDIFYKVAFCATPFCSRCSAQAARSTSIISRHLPRKRSADPTRSRARWADSCLSSTCIAG